MIHVTISKSSGTVKVDGKEDKQLAKKSLKAIHKALKHAGKVK